MAAKVFISCGQLDSELEIAQQIKDILEGEFNLRAYIARETQNLDDIMTIIDHLKSSDYYLFVDFYREANDIYPLAVSLFTHQELALAYHLGFENVIAFKHEKCPLEGFLKYLKVNPIPFSTYEDLIEKFRQRVHAQRWQPGYSRNLVVAEVKCFNSNSPIQYTDATGSWFEYVWHAQVVNHREDTAAYGTVCILDDIEYPDGSRRPSIDRSNLKWAYQQGYERTILPKDFGFIDLFQVRAYTKGIFLHSASDLLPREPVAIDDGDYKLNYKLFSREFPLVNFTVNLNLRWNPPQSQTQWRLDPFPQVSLSSEYTFR